MQIVLVICIRWYLETPIGTVYSPLSGNITQISLLHQSYLTRYCIGIGSELLISDNGYIIRVTKPTKTEIKPSVSTCFDRWFLFRAQLRPFLSQKFARTLFGHGVETLGALQALGQTVGNLYGIGPVTVKRIQEMFLMHQ
jgi:hypothetical protein